MGSAERGKVKLNSGFSAPIAFKTAALNSCRRILPSIGSFCSSLVGAACTGTSVMLKQVGTVVAPEAAVRVHHGYSVCLAPVSFHGPRHVRGRGRRGSHLVWKWLQPLAQAPGAGAPSSQDLSQNQAPTDLSLLLCFALREWQEDLPALRPPDEFRSGLV